MRAALLLPLLLLTLPAHAQWQLLDSNSTADLRGIDNVGKGVVWASGSNGTVLRSEDAGYMWQHCAIPPNAGHLDFRGIQAFDNNTAIVMSSGKGPLSRLYKTTDGCQTWKLVFTNPDKDGFWDAVRFQTIARDPAYLPVKIGSGILLGDPVDGEFVLFRTIDGGNTWTRLSAHKHDRTHACAFGKFAALPGESVFAASNESLAFDDDFTWFFFVTGGAKSRFAYLYHYSELDGLICSDSAKFIKLPLGGSASAGAFATAAKTVKGRAVMHMMVVGGDYRQPDATADTAAFVPPSPPHKLPFLQIVRRSTTPPHGYRSAVAYEEKTKTWITVGPNGTDISTDDGRNWRTLKPNPALHDAPDADRNWNALSLPFVVGPHGRIGLLEPSALRSASH